MKLEIDITKLQSSEFQFIQSLIERNVAKEGEKVVVVKPKEQPKEVVQTPKERPKINLMKKRHGRVVKLFEQFVTEHPQITKSIWLNKLYDRLNIRGGSKTSFVELLRANNYCVERNGSKWRHPLYVMSLNNQQSTEQTVEKPHQAIYFHKRARTAFDIFMSDKTSYYMRKQNMDYYTALRAARADWKGSTHQKQLAKSNEVEFPKFETVKDDYIPILKSMLANMINKGSMNEVATMCFADVSYTLNIASSGDYLDLMREIIQNNKGLKQYYNVNCNKNFVCDKSKLYFR